MEEPKNMSKNFEAAARMRIGFSATDPIKGRVFDKGKHHRPLKVLTVAKGFPSGTAQ
jgi:hypothetical protein